MDVRTNSSPSAETINTLSVGALDHLGRGLFIVTVSAILLFANRTAENLIGKGLYLHRRRLNAKDRVQSETLHQLVLKAARDDAAGSLIITGTDTRDLLLSVIPVRATAGYSRREHPGAMLISKDLRPDTSRRLDALSRYYGLTPAETRVAAELLHGDGTKAVARRLKISEATARTHLIRVFQKTDVGRQAQLVRLILEWSECAVNDAQAHRISEPAG